MPRRFVATAEEPPAEEGAILPEKSGPSSFPDGITGDETEVRQGKTVSPRGQSERSGFCFVGEKQFSDAFQPGNELRVSQRSILRSL